MTSCASVLLPEPNQPGSSRVGCKCVRLALQEAAGSCEKDSDATDHVFFLLVLQEAAGSCEGEGE